MSPLCAHVRRDVFSCCGSNACENQNTKLGRLSKIHGGSQISINWHSKYLRNTHRLFRIHGGLHKHINFNSNYLRNTIISVKLRKQAVNFSDFQMKNSNIFFHISAQNIDGGYSLEPPRRGGSHE